MNDHDTPETPVPSPGEAPDINPTPETPAPPLPAESAAPPEERPDEDRPAEGPIVPIETIIMGPDGTETMAAPVVLATETDRQTVIVRYGAMSTLGRFTHMLDHLQCNQRVVIKSERGQEVGETVCQWGGCGSPAGVLPQIRGEILRIMTHADEVEERHLRETGAREFAYCRECIRTRNLPMKLALVEHLFGGDRVIFHFVSESRVDFRALVRDLAHEFQTRIEMRQIGVRDEARLLGDYERCGRPLCCRAWIKELEPVSMKMAKVQKATLDPTKISGRCGRLMCCLRFEHATYRELAKNLPRKNTVVMTPDGRGTVLDSDIVSQTVRVVLGTGNRVIVPVENLKPADALPPAPADGAPAVATEGTPSAPAGRPPRPGSDRGRQPGRQQTSQRPRTQAPAAVRPEEEPPESRVARSSDVQRDEPLAEEPPAAEVVSGEPMDDVLDETPAETASPAPAGAPPAAPGEPRGERRGRRGRRRSRRGGRNRGRGPDGGSQGRPSGGGTPPAPGSPPESDPPPDRGEAPPAGQQGN